MSRSFRLSVALCMVAAASLLGVPTASATSDTCIYDGPAKTASVYFVSGANTNATVSRESDGNHIMYNGVACGGARVINTNTIIINTYDGTQSLTIDLGDGPFAPGATAEGTGTSEIEFQVDLGAGTDSLNIDGSSGDDHLALVGNGGVKLNADADVDVTLAGVDQRGVYAGSGNDVVAASENTGVVSLYGGGGNDTLTGGGQDDYMTGGLGSDTLKGGSGTDDLYGEEGGDTIKGGPDGDYIYGGDGNDDLQGEGGSDGFYSENAPDGADAMIGGPGGADWVSYQDRTTNVTADLDGNADDGASGEGDRISSDVEELYSGSGNDHLTGSPADNSIDAGAGADTISGGAGSDYLNGRDGADVVHGGADEDSLYGGNNNDKLFGDAGDDGLYAESTPDGNDEYHGGTGDDVVSYYNRTAAVWVRLGGDFEGGVTEADLIASDVERGYGGSGADFMAGTSAANYLYGNGGADTINGWEGADGINGGLGNDTLTGGDGRDYVYGNEDDDTIHVSDNGTDYVYCGTGADIASDHDVYDLTLQDCETIA